MTLNAALKGSMADVPGCIFAGLADLEQGLMIGFSPAAALDVEEVENLAAVAVSYFESDPARCIAGKLQAQCGAINEVVSLNGERSFVFVRLPANAGLVACYISNKTDVPSALLDSGKAGAAALDITAVPA